MLQTLIVSCLAFGSVSMVFAQQPYVITGVQVGSGPVPFRRNINDLYSESGPQWDLYIQALSAMYAMDSADPLSFFQIAGIHGKPFIEWNHTGGQAAFNDWGGYCPHGEPLFVSWHRPYVMLFEQLLVSHAKQIASKYPQNSRNKYMQAAEQLRSPWWDWAATSQVPSVTDSSVVFINTAKGSEAVDNPLLTFKFPKEVLNGKYGDFDSENRQQIYRCQSPQSYPKSANELLGDRNLKESLYDVFTNSETFGQFSSTSERGTSLEQIHNDIHWDAACGGQFLAAEFSAFDPLFMMHHSNVDRLWAYWQAIHPDQARFTQSYSGQGRFSTSSGSTITPDSPLKPFYGKNGLYTTKSVTSIQGFGYTYPGLEYWKKSSQTMKEDATRLINQLYSSNGDVSRRNTRRGATKKRYFAQVQLNAEEVERPCSIGIYVDGKRAASMVVMAQPSKGLVHGAFSLDKALQGAGNSSMSAIQDSVDVKITKIDGSVIQPSSVPSLQVEVEDVDVTPAAKDDELPKVVTKNRGLANITAQFKSKAKLE